jgi:hypothetical protein
MKRHAKPQRKHYLKSARTPIPRKGITRTPRPASETLRIYGPPARRKWITAQPCVFCGQEPDERHPSHNAHTENGGMSRKADYTTIVPACAFCHTLFDKHELPNEGWEVALFARQTETLWQAHLSAHPSPSVRLSPSDGT